MIEKLIPFSQWVLEVLEGVLVKMAEYQASQNGYRSFSLFFICGGYYGVCVYQDAHCRVCHPVAVPSSLTNSRGLKNIACSRCPV